MTMANHKARADPERETEGALLVLRGARGSAATADSTAAALEEAGLEPRPVEGLAGLADLAPDADALFVAAGSLTAEELARLARTLAGEPRLADLPVFAVTEGAEDEDRLEPLRGLGQVTVLGAPASAQAVVAAGRAARRERHRRAYVHHLLGRIEEAELREERLLAVLGHELRNPLGVIATALSVMARIEGDASPGAPYRRMIQRQVEDLARRIDDLLDPAPATTPGPREREWPPPERLLPATGRGREPSGQRTVLIVEDHDDARAALGELLSIWGHRVTPARSGEEALAAAERVRPDLALVDIDLPGIDGYEVARRLRERWPEMELLAMSGYAQPEDRDRSFAAGFDRHLAKPVDPGRLAALIGPAEPA